MPRRSLTTLLLAVSLLLCPTASGAAPPPPEMALTLNYTFEVPAIERDGNLSRVTLDAAALASAVGEPALPAKTARVLLPPGMAVVDVQVSGELAASTILAAPLAPARAPVPLSAPATFPAAPLFGPVYGQSGPYPSTLLGSTSLQRLRGHDILYVSLHPLQYWPPEQRLDSYRALTLTVTLRPATAAPQPSDRSAATLAQLATLVDNPSAAQNAASSPVPLDIGWSTGLLDAQPPCAHVIITSPALRDAPAPDNLQALAAHRTAQGTPSCIITTDWIAAHYDGARPDGGNDLPTAIRALIRDAYATWNTTYVLLAGDADAGAIGGETEAPIVPVRGLAVIAGPYSDNHIPSDLYYACLDGSFDHDADGLYGEPNDGEDGGLVDLLAEVYVGRMAVDSTAELGNMVRKTIAYERSDDAYLDRVLMVGQNLGWASPWGGDRKDAVLRGSSAEGYRTVGFGDSPVASIWRTQTLYDRDHPYPYWTPQQLLALLGQPIHLLNHMGHGSASDLMRLTKAVVDTELANSPGMVGYSQACDVGAFDNLRAWGSPVEDCIVEHLTAGPHGAVAFVANSRYGWGDDIVPELGASQYYDREFWDALLGEGLATVGAAHQDAKEDVLALMGPAGMDDYMRWTAYGLNLLGDPALRVRTPNDQVGARLVELDDSAAAPAQGNGDGQVQAGETVLLSFEAWNGAALPVANATLQAASNDACLTVLSPPVALRGLFPAAVAFMRAPVVMAAADACPDGRRVALQLTVSGLMNGQPRTWSSTETLTIHHPAGADIAVSPEAIIAGLPVSATTTRPLTITNTGTEELVVDFYASGESVGELSASPTLGLPAADYTMLIIASSSLSRIQPLLLVLDETDDIAYALWDATRGTPTAQNLAIYDVVLVGNGAYWESSNINADSLGNALADYVDLGGKVIETQMLHQVGYWGLTGRYIAEHYAPINLATGQTQGDLAVEIVDPTHPLMDGVGAMTTTFRLNVTARPGAIVPAVYAGTTIPYVAANANVVFLNQQFFVGDWGEGERGPLLYNAVRWLCGERGPWVSIEPSSVYIAPGESFDATVTLDSTYARVSSVQRGTLYLDTNSLAHPNLTIPVELAVLGEASTGRLGGVVRSNRTGEPLAGTQVQVQTAGGDPRERTAEAQGNYSFWLTPATYTVTASLPGYVTSQEEVTLAPQTQTKHDITLTRDAPWVRAEATVQSEAVPLGQAVEQAFVLRNDGTRPLELALVHLGQVAQIPLPQGWATLSQEDLTIAPGAQATLRVTLDTASFGGPGLACAAVRLATNDPETEIVVLYAEVAATVPDGYGLVGGVATAVRTGQPVMAEITLRQGATVALAHATAANGAFGPWALPAGEWTVEATSVGYVDATLVTAVDAGQQTEASPALVLDAPWLRLTPDRLVAVNDDSGPVELEVVLANAGTQPLHYAWTPDELPAWISVIPDSGVVSPGSQGAVAVVIDTASAPPGWTVFSAPVTSDDPLQSPAALRLYVQRGWALVLPATLRH